MYLFVNILKAYKENNIKKARTSPQKSMNTYCLDLLFIWDKPWFNVFSQIKMAYWWSTWIYEKQISNR